MVAISTVVLVTIEVTVLHLAPGCLAVPVLSHYSHFL